uniref:Coagulation factor X-like n=1 Tax=Stegastes partitus TaxID=144197 RepID=A0A3B4ZTX3_9TELE
RCCAQTFLSLFAINSFHPSASIFTQLFLDKQQASSLISRQKRSSASTLEQACMEKVCTYEEARRFFQDSYRTDIFWSVYIDGDQCADNPCKNGAMCSDSVGGYDCVCKSGFTGVHCENDQTVCTLEKNKGCSQFCKPGYVSYECSCARGWRLKSSNKDLCEAAGTLVLSAVCFLNLSCSVIHVFVPFAFNKSRHEERIRNILTTPEPITKQTIRTREQSSCSIESFSIN